MMFRNLGATLAKESLLQRSAHISQNLRSVATSTKAKPAQTVPKTNSVKTSEKSKKVMNLGQYRLIDTSDGGLPAPPTAVTIPPPKKPTPPPVATNDAPAKLAVNPAPVKAGVPKSSAAAKSARDNDRHDEVVRMVSEARKRGDIVAFTDGASKNNPGFCGTGITIEIPIHPVDMRTAEEKRQEMLNKMLQEGNANPEFASELNRADAIRLDFAFAWGYGSNNFVEIKGIAECINILTHLDDLLGGDKINIKNKNLHLFSDSNWAINIVAAQWKAKEAYQAMSADIRNSIHEYERVNECQVLLSWIKGHHKCEGNVVADRLANYGALASSNYPDQRTVFGAPVMCNETRIVGLKYIYNDADDIVDAVVAE